MKISSGVYSKVIVLITLSLLATFSSTWAQGTWTTKTSMPTARGSVGIGVINNKLYVVGGENASGALDIVEEYDPATDTWTTKTAMPTARHTFAVGVINNKLYAVGGQDASGSILDIVEEYDPATDSWTTKTAMPTPRHGLGIGVIGNKLYAVGEHNPSGATVEMYDPTTDSWTTKTSMPTARGLLVIGVINNKLYAVGGTPGGQQSLDLVEEYDPVTDTWTTKTAMPTPRHGLAAGVIGDRLYAVGGFTAPSTYLDVVEEYDPGTDSWSTMQSMPTVRQELGVGVVGGKLYAVGGKDPGNNHLSTVEEFTLPQAISFTKYEGNPVIDLGSSGQLDDTHVLAPSVLKMENEYKMWYAGHDGSVGRIFYATSNDGITWTKYSTTPVLDLGQSGEWDDVEVGHPSVILDNGTYKMWYTGHHSGSLHQIGYATSSDGISWTRHAGNPVLTPGPDAWDNTAVQMSTVIKDGTTYKMWYCGYTPGSLYQIGYATSSDGMNWTKHSGPVIQKGSNGGWDDTALESPSIVRVDSLYYTFYTAQASPGAPRKIGYATSSDGINWTKYTNNPVLAPGSSGEWDDTGVGAQFVIYNNGTYEMWYSGDDGTNQRIGYANSTGVFDTIEGPSILAIIDVPNDQGRRVRVSWRQAPSDIAGAVSTVITNYTLWRRIDPNLPTAGTKVLVGTATPSGEWDFVTTVPAVQDSLYHVVAPTLADSTVSGGIYYSVFFVRAHTADPLVHFESAADSGYSVDNLVPTAPGGTKLVGIDGSGNVTLAWDDPVDADFNYFEVSRSANSSFTKTSRWMPPSLLGGGKRACRRHEPSCH